MKPEYQFKVEGLVNKEQVMNGLMASGYILSVQTRFGNIYEISVYGKERVDGNGMKPTEWTTQTVPSTTSVGPGTYIKTPYYPSTTAYFGASSIDCGTIVTNGIKESELNPTIKAELHEQKMKDIIKKAIDNNYGC